MPRLPLTTDDFRSLAQEIVELCAQHLDTLDSKPIFPQTSGTEVEKLFADDWPEQPLQRAALNQLRDVASHSRAQNGRFFGYVLGSGEPVAALADLVASILNQNVTAWRSGPAAAAIEHTVVGWLADAIGCKGMSGTLCGGGSPANLMGLAMAREAKAPANEKGSQPGVVYASAEAHMSIAKAVALLGIGRQNLRLIPCDDALRMRVDELQRVLQKDAAAGITPIAIIATAGTVNTGAIDPLPEIAGMASRYNAWMHVDGAYGALAALAAPEKFLGLRFADSIALDPHKWLYQPLDCGCLLYSDAEAARRAFSFTGDYARSLSGDPVEGFAFFEESMELSRRFRALKLWLSLRYHGKAAFRDSIREDLRLAQILAEKIGSSSDVQLLAPVTLSAICFRYRPPAMSDGAGHDTSEEPAEAAAERESAAEAELNELNRNILDRVIRNGRVYLSNASLGVRFALRACITNHRTTEADIDEILTEVRAAAAVLTETWV
jgi:aromatic-L-amino-acid decarboxylase